MLSRCAKHRLFNVFNFVAVFLIINFCIYRFFVVPKTKITPAVNTDPISTRDLQHSNQINTNPARDATPNEGGGGNPNDNIKNVNNNNDNNNNIKISNSSSSSSSSSPSSSKLKQSLTPSNNKTSSSIQSSSSSSTSVISKTNSNNATKSVATEKKPPAESTVTEKKSDQQQSNEDGQELPLCPLIPPNLNGPLATYSHTISFKKIREDNYGLMPGGRYKPPDCIARHRVAIVIPYRNREEHLQILLNNLHPMLMRQQLDYGIFVIDQALPTRFNRAMLMNIGYAEAMKRYDYQCAVFHDVDLLPENDKNIYSCPEMPRHLSAAIDKFRYRLPYAGIYGGVSAVKKDQFEKMNGFSNMFFGWGGEDDDMAKRISASGFKITRYPMDIARYRMIKHTKDKGNESNPQRFNLLRTSKQRMKTDGLNALKYKVQVVDEQPTHLRLEVFIDQDEIMKSSPNVEFLDKTLFQ